MVAGLGGCDGGHDLDNVTTGIVLAGGRASRMGGGDKGLLRVAGRSIVARVIERLRPQVSALVLNANGDPDRFAALGLPVVADTVSGQPGPLAGVLAGLNWMSAHAPGQEWLVSVPADVPFLPIDLVPRLLAMKRPEAVTCAGSGGRVHPVVALWPQAMRGPLLAALQAGQRSVGQFVAGGAVAIWPTVPFDPFFNINTPQDLIEAERIALTL